MYLCLTLMPYCNLKMENMKKISWIYYARALAIVAVVVCHQQNILHTSEVVQGITLFSVTTLIFLMGVTEAFSLNRTTFKRGEVIVTQIKRKKSILFSYVLATIVYLCYLKIWTGNELETLSQYLLNFSACGPFYFVKYVLSFSLFSPCLCFITQTSHLNKCLCT